MSDVYVYIQFKIRNANAFAQYAQAVTDTVTLYGGKTLAVNKAPETIHGEINADVCVIQQWPSLQAAKDWHNSPEYAPLKALRDNQAMSDLRIIPIPVV